MEGLQFSLQPLSSAVAGTLGAVANVIVNVGYNARPVDLPAHQDIHSSLPRGHLQSPGNVIGTGVVS